MALFNFDLRIVDINDADIHLNNLSDLANKTVVFGDMHASAKKIIEYLFKLGLIDDIQLIERFDSIYKESYSILKKIQTNAEEDLFDRLLNHKLVDFQNLEIDQYRNSIDELISIIDQLNFKKVPVKLLFLGDLLFDKGLCDIVNLRLLNKIKLVYSTKILISNHDWNFIYTLPNINNYISNNEIPIKIFINKKKNGSLARAVLYCKNLDMLKAFTSDFLNFLAEEELFIFEQDILYSHTMLADSEDLENTARGNLIAKLLNRIDVKSSDLNSFVQGSNEFAKKNLLKIKNFESLSGEEKTELIKDIELVDHITWYVNKKDEHSFTPSLASIQFYVHGHYSYRDNLIPSQNALPFKTINLNDMVYRGEKIEYGDQTYTSRILLVE